VIKVLSIIGTRPEAIKMAPVIRALGSQSDIESVVCSTGQHREMLNQIVSFFSIKPDFDLNLMQPRQHLCDIAGKVLIRMGKLLDEVGPDWVLVQGDTVSASFAGLASFYHQIRIGHVEAGLRTRDKYEPFPEEINRRLLGVVADLHFAPTEKARSCLLEEGVDPKTVIVTGNTAIDSLIRTQEKQGDDPPVIPSAILQAMAGRKMILVTGHRRENLGGRLRDICRALAETVERNKDVCVVYPVHLNPEVQRTVNEVLCGQDRIVLSEPLPYPQFVWLMSHAHILLSDSGGIQEEAPALNKPILITRNNTERPEGVESGCAKLVGTDMRQIVSEIELLLEDSSAYEKMASSPNPYGDGTAALKVVDALRHFKDFHER